MSSHNISKIKLDANFIQVLFCLIKVVDLQVIIMALKATIGGSSGRIFGNKEEIFRILIVNESCSLRPYLKFYFILVLYKNGSN